MGLVGLLKKNADRRVQCGTRGENLLRHEFAGSFPQTDMDLIFKS
jgi:hypothetical protein